MSTQTANDLVVDALRLIMAIPAGELPSGYEAQDGQMRLNDLLANWATQQLEVFFIQNLTSALGSGVFAITAGTGGGLTTRPIKIETANALRSGVATPIKVVNSVRWAKIADKAATGKVPEFLYNDNSFPLANLNLWPGTSDTNTTLDLWIWGEFTTLTTTLYTDLVIDNAAANKVTSALNPFVAGDVGNFLNVPYGISGFTPGRYTISSVLAGVATLSANIGTLAQTGGMASYDQALALPPGYWKAIRFNLAADLIPEYGRANQATVGMILKTAAESKAELRGANQANESATEAPPVPDAPAQQTPAQSS